MSRFRRWYCGLITDYDPKDNKHLVHYDDEKDEWELLRDEICHIFHSRDEVRRRHWGLLLLRTVPPKKKIGVKYLGMFSAPWRQLEPMGIRNNGSARRENRMSTRNRNTKLFN